MPKKIKKDVQAFSGGILTLGVGSAIGAKLNTQQSSFDAAAPFATASRFTPIVATGLGASAALRSVRRIAPRPKKRKRRR